MWLPHLLCYYARNLFREFLVYDMDYWIERISQAITEELHGVKLVGCE